jgi:GDP-4-dehydro-6-deoxy-D-mannose reductase
VTCDVFVTGARGFVGRHVLERARSADLRVQSAHGDLREPDALDSQIAHARPRAVVHLAAARRGGDPWRALCHDVAMTGAVLTAVARHTPGTPVLIPGSAAQYGMAAPRPLDENEPTAPVTPYGVAKSVLERAATAAALRGPVRVIATRSFNHIGPGQGLDAPAAQWARQLVEAETAGGGTIRAGNLDVVRDLLDVRDIADAYLALIRTQEAEGVVNVCSGVAVPMRCVAELVAGRATVSVSIERDPALARRVDPPHIVGDPSRLRALTGWTPTVSLEQSVADLVDAYRRAGEVTELAS